MTEVSVALTGTAVDQSLREVEDYISARLAVGTPGPAVDLVEVRALDLPGPAQPGSAGEYEPLGRAVFPIWLHRTVAVLGPSWQTGLPGPCPACLATRWRAIRAKEEIEALDDGGAAFAAGALPGLTPFALEAMWTVLGDAMGHPQVVAIRYDTLELKRFPLVADSVCPVCSAPEPDSPEEAAVELASRAKVAVNSYRLRTPSDYGLPVDAYVNPVCGMLGQVALPSYHVASTAPSVGAFHARSRFGLHEMRWAGHGIDYRTSELLGVLEGLERYASLRPRARSATVFDSYENLKSDAVDPLECGVYTDEFYTSYPRNYRRYEPDQAIHWVWGYSLRDNRPLLVPEQLVYYLDRRPEYLSYVQESSNGCASGSCLEEAVLHAMLELVERDAFLLCWFGRARLPEIDLATCASEQTQAMAGRMRLLGYETHLFDMRVDLSIPAVMAVARLKDTGIGNLCFAAGASFDPEAAVAAALRETASYVFDMAARVAQIEPELRLMLDDYNRVFDLAHHSVLFGLPEMAPQAQFLFECPPRRSMSETYAGWLDQRPQTLDLRDDVRHLVDLVSGLGYDVVVVDQTCPEQAAVGLHTVCVVVPGLLPIDFGWQRQRAPHMRRMRTAFRTAGWRADDLRPDELHLVPHPFP